MCKDGVGFVFIPPTQTSVENGNWIQYHPLTTVGDGSPIEFDTAGNGEDYIDLAKTMLYVQAKITQQDGSDLVDDARGDRICQHVSV